MYSLRKKHKIHFIGVGGIGMSGIAELLLDSGHDISGSDINKSAITDKLEAKGLKLFSQHHERNLLGVTLVVYSSAINEQNPELSYALKNNIPIIKRAEMLAELMRLKLGIGIAGSHGKTTTTSLTATIFHESGRNPTHVTGGIVHSLGGNAKKGTSEFMIAEADESDGSFLFLKPIMAVVTNIDNDHLDHYRTEENLIAAFVQFVNSVPFYGMGIINQDDKRCQKIIPSLKRTFATFSLKDKAATYYAEEVSFDREGTKFSLFHNAHFVQKMQTPLLGTHNLENALAALATSHQAGLSFEDISKGLLSFKGVGRRLEILTSKEKYLVIDDYAHHPTEILATVSTLKKCYDDYQINVVFQPHRFSRTKKLWSEFVEALSLPDHTFLTDIYPASEDPIEGIDSQKLREDISKIKNCTYLSDWSQLKDELSKERQRKTLWVSMGAGSISRNMKEILKEMN